MINLSRVKAILAEAEAIVSELDGTELDETNAVASQTKSKAREVRARKSQDLNLLADRLQLAAQLVRTEYWFARGESDPIDERREQ